MISELRNFTSRMMRSICFLCFKYIHNIFALEKQIIFLKKVIILSSSNEKQVGDENIYISWSPRYKIIHSVKKGNSCRSHGASAAFAACLFLFHSFAFLFLLCPLGVGVRPTFTLSSQFESWELGTDKLLRRYFFLQPKPVELAFGLVTAYRLQRKALKNTNTKVGCRVETRHPCGKPERGPHPRALSRVLFLFSCWAGGLTARSLSLLRF